ncbi:MAG: hypothetical protein IJT70_06670 [Clostridia bacterium]|nr:hypothetical protein [Clostridia bacterium]
MLENYDKDYLKRVLLRIAGIVVGLLAIAYIGYQIWHKMTLQIKYEPATPYTYTEKIVGEGYVFRNETVIRSESGGNVVSEVEQGEKVSANSEVAKLYSATGEDIEQKLADIDRQIALLSATGEDEQFTTRDVSKLDGETYDVITDMRRCVEQGNYIEAVSHKFNLITKVNRRDAASGNAGDVSSKIAELRSKRNEITAQLGSLLSEVTTPVAGWYYPETDGYEEIFSSKKIENITFDVFRDIISTPAESTVGDAGKTVVDRVWYFVVELSKDEIKDKLAGDEYTIFFPHNNGKKIRMTIDKVCLGEDGNGIVVFKTDRIPEGFDFVRMQSYELINNEYTGFKIPRGAVRFVDGQMGVYVLTGEVVHFRKIEVLTEYENTYIVVMDHSVKKEEETTASGIGDVAQSPEWVPDSAGSPTATESDAAIAPDQTDPGTSAEEKAEFRWLGLNENVIISGKGLSDGMIITKLK